MYTISRRGTTDGWYRGASVLTSYVRHTNHAALANQPLDDVYEAGDGLAVYDIGVVQRGSAGGPFLTDSGSPTSRLKTRNARRIGSVMTATE